MGNLGEREACKSVIGNCIHNKTSNAMALISCFLIYNFGELAKVTSLDGYLVGCIVQLHRIGTGWEVISVSLEAYEFSDRTPPHYTLHGFSNSWIWDRYILFHKEFCNSWNLCIYIYLHRSMPLCLRPLEFVFITFSNIYIHHADCAFILFYTCNSKS